MAVDIFGRPTKDQYLRGDIFQDVGSVIPSGGIDQSLSGNNGFNQMVGNLFTDMPTQTGVYDPNATRGKFIQPSGGFGSIAQPQLPSTGNTGSIPSGGISNIGNFLNADKLQELETARRMAESGITGGFSGGNTGSSTISLPSGGFNGGMSDTAAYGSMALGGLLGGDLTGALQGAGGYYAGKKGIEGAVQAGETGFNLSEQQGQRAYDQAQFRPFGVTSNLANVQTGASGGVNVTLSPQQQAMQNQLLGSAGQLSGNIGGQYNPAVGQIGQQAYGQAAQQLGQATSYDPSLSAQRGAIGGLFGQQLGQYGQPTGLEGLTQAGLGGALSQFGTAGQPADINQLRGQFANQVGGYLGQQPNKDIGRLGTQALQLGSQGLQNIAPDPTLSGLQQQLGTRASNLLSQTASTLPSQVASQMYGLGMQGLQNRSAPTDIEALRSQYAGLAGQAGQGLLTSPEQRQSDIYESIRATQRPEEERAAMRLQEQLLGQGRAGISTDAYGGTPEQLAMAKAQAEAGNSAALMARQQAMSEQQQAMANAQGLTGLASGLAGTSSDLQSAAQSRASQLTQLGLSADQIQSKLESEGLSRGLQATQTTGQTAGMLSDLQSSAQSRASQLSQLGLSAEQIQSQLQSEGLSRGVTAGSTAGQLAGIASDLESAGISRGATLSNVGLAGQQAGQQMSQQQLANLLSLQQADIGAAGAQQGLQQGNLALGSGLFGLGQQAALTPAQLQGADISNMQALMNAGYNPQQQALNLFGAGVPTAQIAQRGQLGGTELQSQATGQGIESYMQGANMANLLQQQQLQGMMSSAFGSQPTVQEQLLSQLLGQGQQTNQGGLLGGLIGDGFDWLTGLFDDDSSGGSGGGGTSSAGKTYGGAGSA